MAARDPHQPDDEADYRSINGYREIVVADDSFPIQKQEVQPDRGEREILAAVQQLIQDYKAVAASPDRRRKDRMDFIQPVEVVTEDGRRRTLLSRDLSVNGIRLIASLSMLGQKIRVYFPSAGRETSWAFTGRVVWSCAVGENLFENGCAFLQATKVEKASQSL